MNILIIINTYLFHIIIYFTINIELSYIPCAAHNIQLVIKDGLNFDSKYSALIDRISTDIVSKSKFSHHLAEELRALDVQLCKQNLTRWNSILFMVRSVLKLSCEQYKNIRDEMKERNSSNRSKETAIQLHTRKNFGISELERKMLKELVILLEAFEFVTNQFQGDGVSISKVC